jgi:GNAT superfamily N-acetyltransferase
MDPDFSFPKSRKEIAATYEVMHQLRPKLSKADYLKLVNELSRDFGYRLMALKLDGQVKCVAGFRMCHSLGWGKYLYVDELVTDARTRSRGLGTRALAFLAEYARTNGCGQLRLDSKLNRHRAHRFYLRERMDIECFHFLKNLA